MAEIMSQADISIGAGGSACWERCCLGLPSLIVAVADNQIHIAKALDSIGAGVYLGAWQDVDINNLKDAIKDLMINPVKVNEISKKSIALVDGLGASRVAEILLS
jgi:UDP-2,4-diacetamido-2,4,6-trideoxy-beta-L-altropyranose hydrolase